jgi:hypothetical protein
MDGAEHPRTALGLRLPREHGFWVMLGGTLVDGMLRTSMNAATLLVAAVVALGAVGGAAAAHRRVRSRGSLQVAAALVLAVAGAPIEAAAGAPFTTLLVSAGVKSVVFISSVLVVRAALATSGKNGSSRSARLYLMASVLALAGAGALTAAHRAPEAIVCVLAIGSILLSAHRRPTAKDLKPLGLYVTALTLLTTLAPLFS